MPKAPQHLAPAGASVRRTPGSDTASAHDEDPRLIALPLPVSFSNAKRAQRFRELQRRVDELDVHDEQPQVINDSAQSPEER